MSFESFYGGRQGASFVIVKRFDTINLSNATSIYKTIQCAVDSDGNYICESIDPTGQADPVFIYKSGFNYANYLWKWTLLDGSTVDAIIDGTPGTIYSVNLPVKNAEGMVECFSQGGDSTDVVNYGEYVIIDTPVKNDPTNGMVFRRGMNYDYDPVNNPYAGGEYIGQIVGPQGDIPELELMHYNEVIDVNPHAEKAFNVTDGDITPGSWVENEGTPQEERKFKDDMDYSYVTLRDEFGNVNDYWIAFKWTTLVQDFEGYSISSYENRYLIDPDHPEKESSYVYRDLIYEDPNEYHDGKWNHPFYEKWQVKIPKGLHGIDSTDLQIVPTKTMPEGFKSDTFKGAQVFIDEACTDPLLDADNNEVFLKDATVITLNDDNDKDPRVGSAKVKYQDVIRYVKKEECYMYVVRYAETDFVTSAEGVKTFKNVCDYNDIVRITLSQNGLLKIYYTGKEEPELRTADLLKWIDYINIDEDGTVKYYYNTNPDHEIPAKVQSKLIRFIKDLQIQIKADGSLDPNDIWTGDQKIHVTYNNEKTGYPQTVAIGEPINYVIETVVVTKNVTRQDGQSIYGHLLAWYSDPAYRNRFSNLWASYPSQKINGFTFDEWVDMGNIRGDAGGIHYVTEVNSLDELKVGGVSTGDWIPPEELRNSQGDIINPNAEGWCVNYTYVPDPSLPTVTTTEILCFDYDIDSNGKYIGWYSLGSIDSSMIDPSKIIIEAEEGAGGQVPPAAVNLNDGGFWLVEDSIINAHVV